MFNHGNLSTSADGKQSDGTQAEIRFIDELLKLCCVIWTRAGHRAWDVLRCCFYCLYATARLLQLILFCC